MAPALSRGIYLCLCLHISILRFQRSCAVNTSISRKIPQRNAIAGSSKHPGFRHLYPCTITPPPHIRPQWIKIRSTIGASICQSVSTGSISIPHTTLSSPKTVFQVSRLRTFIRAVVQRRRWRGFRVHVSVRIRGRQTHLQDPLIKSWKIRFPKPWQ